MNFHIRKFKKADLYHLYKLLSNKKVMEYLEEPFDLDKTKKFFHEVCLREEPLLHAIEDENGKFIGYTIFHPYDEKGYELGWVLTPESWNKGYAKAITKHMIVVAENMHQDVVIECMSTQEVTRHIALSFGFKEVGKNGILDVYRLYYENYE